LLQNLSSATATRRLGQIAGQLAPYQATVNVDPTNQKVHLEIYWGQQGGNSVANQSPQPSSAAPSSKPEEKKAAPVEQKEYTIDEVSKHNTEQDCWGKVLFSNFIFNFFCGLLICIYLNYVISRYKRTRFKCYKFSPRLVLLIHKKVVGS
jgi:hypothetical protein